eukprot:1110774-Rhodomonas_salina.1
MNSLYPASTDVGMRWYHRMYWIRFPRWYKLLPAYALATACPVLTSHMLVGLSGTDLNMLLGLLGPQAQQSLCDSTNGYGSNISYSTHGNHLHHSPILSIEIPYGATLSFYATWYRRPGTDLQYAATRSITTALLRFRRVKSAISLRACYAMPGTDVVYGARAQLATVPTVPVLREQPYHTPPSGTTPCTALCACYTLCAVLTSRM